MTVLLIIIISVYILTINIFGFTLVATQKKQLEEKTTLTVKDSKLFVTAILGGGVGIFSSILILKYRLQSMFLMVFIPIIIAINIYFLFLLFTSGLLFNNNNVATILNVFYQ